MKKNKAQDQEQKRKSRRLSLSRETIRFLDDPVFLELARGGGTLSGGVPTNCATVSDPTSGGC